MHGARGSKISAMEVHRNFRSNVSIEKTLVFLVTEVVTCPKGRKVRVLQLSYGREGSGLTGDGKPGNWSKIPGEGLPVTRTGALSILGR